MAFVRWQARNKTRVVRPRVCRFHHVRAIFPPCRDHWAIAAQGELNVKSRLRLPRQDAFQTFHLDHDIGQITTPSKLLQAELWRVAREQLNAGW